MILNAKLGLFVFFILTTSFVSSDEETTKPVLVPRPIPKKESDEFVAELNKRRRTFAKEHNIANMHELKWSQHLVDLVSVDAKQGTTEDSAEKNYKGADSFSSFLKDIEEVIGSLRRDLEKGSKEESYRNNIVALSPVHREIGCTEAIWRNKYYKDCYLAPGALVGIHPNSWEAVQEIVSVNGEPGSQCYEGYGNNDGLCSLPSTTTTEAPTTTTTTTTPEPTTTTATEATTTEEPEFPKVTQKVKDVPAPDAPKPQPTQRPALVVPEKQTSDGEAKDSEESEDVEESEESGSSTLVSLYSVLVHILLVQFSAFF